MPDVPDINKSLGELEEELQSIKDANGLIQDAKKTTEETITNSKKILNELIKKSQNATEKAITESGKLNESAKMLFEAVNDLMNRLDKVDFPVRLDKLDSSITGINTGIQNVVGRLDTIERNLKDDLSSGFRLTNKKVESVEKSIVNLLNSGLTALHHKTKKYQLINSFLFFITISSIITIIVFSILKLGVLN